VKLAAAQIEPVCMNREVTLSRVGHLAAEVVD
jgi:hypothetical protein